MNADVRQVGLSLRQRFLKRSLDFCVSLIGLLCTFWLILLAWMLASLETGENGIFTQIRVGRNGRLFRVFKIRTMRTEQGGTTVTTDRDPRITRTGRFFRRTKIDELPQLINVLLGQMSLVGPRPDVPGYADRLVGDDRVILTIRPGITGPATLRFRNEEILLAAQGDPRRYNDEVLYPEKVRINREYIANYSFVKDLKYIFKTVIS